MCPRPRRTIRLLEESFPERPVYDMAFSRALLERVAAGMEPETLRLHGAGNVVAFGPVDRTRPGFPRAVAAARRAGFEAVVRLAGGRAAVFHTETLAFSWVIPAADSRAEIVARFDETAAIVSSALVALGIDARVGEVRGEYCPGGHSVNARGVRKIMGVGQRVVKGAAHVGGVVVVGGSERVRDVVTPVYEALGLTWDPATAGSVEDEIGPISTSEVSRALLHAFAERYEISEASPTAQALTLAERLEADHRAPESASLRGKGESDWLSGELPPS